MVLVILEGRVPEDQWDALRRAFRYAMKHRPDAIISSLLAQDIHDKNVWRIHTLWTSHEAAISLYEDGATMPSTYTFHLVGVVPDMTINDVSEIVDDV